MKTLILALWALLVLAQPVQAAPILGLFAMISSFTIGGIAVGSFLVNTVGGILVSALNAAIQGNRRSGRRGIETEVALTGELNPQSFIVGRYATAGAHVWTPTGHDDGGTPNRMLVQIFDLGDFTGGTLDGVIHNAQELELSDDEHPDYGRKVLGDYEDRMWVRFHDGTQTEADALLIDKYSDHPERPWSSDMIGRGKVYAIVTTKLQSSLWNGRVPEFTFVLWGMPFYDVRKDSSVGGSGSHRWDDPATWEVTENNIVIAYNIKRGIVLPDGSVYGGDAEFEDLPLSEWAAAMNACDLDRETSSGMMPSYRAGYEVKVDEEPASVISKLMTGCNGAVAPDGGMYRVRAGTVNLPAFFITDDDILGDRAQTMDPWPDLGQVVNGIEATFPNPDAAWQATDAPALYDAELEAEDQGRRKVKSVDFATVPFPLQVQWLMLGLKNNARRFLRHTLPLGPEAAFLGPLDVISWTSDYNQYSGKLFEIARKSTGLRDYVSSVDMLEVDPSDDAWDISDEKPTYRPPVVKPPVSFKVVCVMVPDPIKDGTGTPKRPGCTLTFGGFVGEGIEYEIRDATTFEVVAMGTSSDTESGVIVVSEGLIAGQEVQGRLRPVGQLASDWSDWASTTVPDVPTTVAQSNNMLVNADYAQGLLCFEHRSTGDIGTDSFVQLRQAGETHAGADYPTLEVGQDTGLVTTNGFVGVRFHRDQDGASFPIDATKWYELSAALSVIDAKVKFRVLFYDASGTEIANLNGPNFTTIGAQSSDNPETWPRRVQKFCPAEEGYPETASVRVEMRIYERTATAATRLYIHKPLLSETEAGVVTLPWSPPAVTSIDGLNVKNLTVTGDMILDGRIKVVYDAQSGHGSFDKTVVAAGHYGTIALADQANATTVFFYFEVLPDGANAASFTWSIVCENSDYFSGELVLATGTESVPAGGPLDFVIERQGVGYSGRPMNVGDTVYLKISNVTGSFDLAGQISAEQTKLVGKP